MQFLTLCVCAVLGVTTFENADGLKTREKIQLSSRFLIDFLIPSKIKKEECILCKCYKECHAGQYLIDENSVCSPYWNSISCSEIDRCSCCNDLVLYHPCKSRGQCTNTGNGHFSCKCIAGFYGQKCEHAGIEPVSPTTDYCSSTPCLNGAACSTGTLSYSCTCQKGWTGRNCEKDMNECTSNPCRNDETCINTIGGFQCRQGNINGDTNFTAGTLGICDHECTIETVAKLTPVESNQTELCPGTAKRGGNEALLVECCGLGRSTAWYKGLQVMQLCKNNTVSSYTPIAAVVNGKVVPDTAGVLVACNDNGPGFKMILQKCNASPQVITVDGTAGVDPKSYFVMFKI